MSRYTDEDMLGFEISERDGKLCEYSHLVDELKEKICELESKIQSLKNDNFELCEIIDEMEKEKQGPDMQECFVLKNC